MYVAFSTGSRMSLGNVYPGGRMICCRGSSTCQTGACPLPPGGMMNALLCMRCAVSELLPGRFPGTSAMTYCTKSVNLLWSMMFRVVVEVSKKHLCT